ncbi:MAG: bifunctional (p)ppGpp synthetase/guanosine-3',5'-bis(diphosphate) 3'-pyrophosphohydrolase, partial [Anaerolineae bacterium]|nr:bifunctional (p)ppGpp synthetase/guanosine-3',5'-bis(diphosphate) 3'-pyrophosphohydrolase [Anaerolineae bacterium]
GTLPKAQQMQDSLQRIVQRPVEVWMVKLADRIANLSPPPHYWSRDKRAHYRDEARDIHAALHQASAYLGQRLLDKIDEYESCL